jgi:CheY-like chemotaxis protein
VNNTDKTAGTVLLADDEEMVIKASTELFQALGYEVLPARGGQEAIRLCQQNKEQIDLAILDVTMPGMSGEDICRKLKQIKPEMKIVFSSGYTLEYLAQTTEVQGYDAFIEKPFGIDTLTEMLKEIMD